ncbi:GpE family phage tail protein [Rahnella variigena]|nr:MULTISPECIES: GpE family phage tail protein [Rahnella]MDH2898853.1 GpE family phage tail protein [Rahnella variigena]
MTFPPHFGVDDLMADVAVVFHWPPSELYPMSPAELAQWRAKAIERSGHANE